MRLSFHVPGGHPLPYGMHAHPAEPGTRLPLHPDEVARFDSLLHELHPDARRADPDRIQQLADWLVAQPRMEADAVLEERLQRIADIRAMLDDPDWDTSEAMRSRLLKLLAYVDREDDLIPDTTPLLGRLDDVLLLELAWPAFEAEVEDYRDFCTYCREHRLTGADPMHRNVWIEDRCAEIASRPHPPRGFGHHYTSHPAEGGLFRIG